MAERSVNIRLSLQDGEVVKRALMTLGEEGERALRRIEAHGVPTSRALKAVDQAAREAKDAVSSWAAEAGASGRVLAAFGPGGLAAAAGIGLTVLAFDKLKDRTVEALQHLNELQDTADRLGTGTGFLQAIRFAGGQSGVGTEQIDASLQKLSVTLGEVARGNAPQAAAALQRLGISATDSFGQVKTLEQAVPELADGFSRLRGTIEGNSLAMDLFGRGNVALAHFLAQGSAALKEQMQIARDMGAVLDENVVKSGAEAANKLKALSTVITAQLDGALVDLAPLLIEGAKAFAEFAKWAGDAVDSLRALDEQRLTGLHQQFVQAQDDLARLKALKAADPSSESSITKTINDALDSAEAQAVRIGDLLTGNTDDSRIHAAEAFGKRLGNQLLGNDFDSLIADAEARVKRLGDALERRAGEEVNEARKGPFGLPPPIAPDRAAKSAADTTHAIREQRDAYAELVKQIQFETEQTARSAREQFIYNELQQAGVEITSARGQEIARLAGTLYDAQQAEKARSDAIEEAKRKEQAATKADAERAAQVIDAGRDSLKSFVLDADRAALAGQNFWASLAKAGLDALEQLQQKLLEFGLDQLLGTSGRGGQQSFGILGSLFGRLFSSPAAATPAGSPTFGGPRAFGGDASVGRFYRVNERNLEGFFAPSMPGRIVPLGPAMAGGGREPQVTVVVNNHANAEVEPRTRRNASGGIDVELMVRGIVKDELASAGGQDLVKRVYGISQPPIRRR